MTPTEANQLLARPEMKTRLRVTEPGPIKVGKFICPICRSEHVISLPEGVTQEEFKPSFRELHEKYGGCTIFFTAPKFRSS